MSTKQQLINKKTMNTKSISRILLGVLFTSTIAGCVTGDGGFVSLSNTRDEVIDDDMEETTEEEVSILEIDSVIVPERPKQSVREGRLATEGELTYYTQVVDGVSSAVLNVGGEDGKAIFVRDPNAIHTTPIRLLDKSEYYIRFNGDSYFAPSDVEGEDEKIVIIPHLANESTVRVRTVDIVGNDETKRIAKIEYTFNKINAKSGYYIDPDVPVCRIFAKTERESISTYGEIVGLKIWVFEDGYTDLCTVDFVHNPLFAIDDYDPNPFPVSSYRTWVMEQILKTNNGKWAEAEASADVHMNRHRMYFDDTHNSSLGINHNFIYGGWGFYIGDKQLLRMYPTMVDGLSDVHIFGSSFSDDGQYYNLYIDASIVNPVVHVSSNLRDYRDLDPDTEFEFDAQETVDYSYGYGDNYETRECKVVKIKLDVVPEHIVKISGAHISSEQEAENIVEITDGTTFLFHGAKVELIPMEIDGKVYFVMGLEAEEDEE